MNDHLNIKDYWRKLREGDPDALSALYRLHYVGLINYGVKFTGNRDMANDCIVSVLLELWEKRDSLPAVENVRSYLITCLHRRILLEIKHDKRRDKGHRGLYDNSEPNERPHEEHLTLVEDKRLFNQRFAEAFRKLTLRQQQLLRMKFFEDLDYDSIAISCNITKRTAYNIIHDALQQLKHELKDTSFQKDFFIPEALLLLLLPALMQHLHAVQ